MSKPMKRWQNNNRMFSCVPRHQEHPIENRRYKRALTRCCRALDEVEIINQLQVLEAEAAFENLETRVGELVVQLDQSRLDYVVKCDVVRQTQIVWDYIDMVGTDFEADPEVWNGLEIYL